MKVLKVYDDAHRRVKMEAAKSGRTTVNVASVLLRHALSLVDAGKLDLGKIERKQEAEVGAGE